MLTISAFGVFKVLRGVQQSRLQADARSSGLAAYHDGAFETTLEHLGYVIAQDKSDVDVLLAFADARARTPLTNGKNIMEALGYYRASVDLLEDPNSDIPESMDRTRQVHECWSRMMELYSVLGMRYEVKETAERLLATEPDNVEALTARVQVLYAERDFNEAMRAAQRLVELQPQELRWRELQLAIMRKAGRDVSDLLAQCGKWMANHAGDGRYHVLEAAVLADAGRFVEARDAIGNAATLGADTLDVLNMMVSMLDALGQYDTAQKLIERTSGRYPDAVWLQQAVIRRHWQANRIDAAIALLDDVQAATVALEPPLIKLKALCLMSADRTDEAIVLLEPLTQTSNTYERAEEAVRSWARAMIMQAQPGENDYSDVLRDVEHALVLQPRDAVLHSVMGRTYTAMGEDALAVQHYETAHRLDPSWLAAGVTYIESLLRIGRVGEAYRTSVRILRRQPTDMLAPFVLCARSYMDLLRSGQIEQIASTGGPAPDVVRILETLHDERPADPVIAGLLAEGYILTGQKDLARRFIDAAAGQADANAQMLLELAQVSRRYDIDSAASLIEQAAAAAPDSLAVAYSKADLLAQAGDVTEGLALLDAAIARVGDNPADRRTAERARVKYLLRVDHADAVRELEAFVTNNRDSADTLGFALEQAKLWDHETVLRQVIDDLTELVGRNAQQVRLAEANYLMRYKSDNEADLARAMVQINSVLEESPDSLAALTLLANASLLGERPSIERAIVNLQRAVERYPGATTLYPVFIDLLQRQGDFATAERYLDRFAALAERQPRWQHEEIRLLRAQGNFERALIKASSMINEHSETTDQLALANLYRRSGRTEQAGEIFGRLLATSNPSGLVIERAAEFYALSGDVERAEQLLHSYTPADGEGCRKELLLGRFAMQYGNPAQAAAHLESAARSNPESRAVQYELARHHLSTEQYRKAHDIAMAALRADPMHRGLRTVLALSTIRMDAETQAQTIKFWNGLQSDDDALLETLALLQSVRFEDGRAQPTGKDIDAARDLASRNGAFLPSWMLAISLMADSGRTNDAIDMARRAVGRFPTEPQVARWATSMLMSAGRWQEALMEAQEWRRRTLDDPIDADVAMTTILLKLDRSLDAFAQIEAHGMRIVDQRTRRPGRVGPWLSALLANDKWTQASELAHMLVAEDARWRSLWMQLSAVMTPEQAYDALANVEQHIAEAQSYLELALAWNSLAGRTSEMSYYARADALVVRAAELDASLQTEVLVTRGMIAQGKGEDVLAERYYRQVIERDPDNVTTLNNLAFLLVRNGRRFEQALPIIEHAVSLMPEHPDLLDTKGQVLLGLGQLDTAAETLAKARSLRPRDMNIGLNLAEALIEQGTLREASFVLEDVGAELELTWPRDDAIQQRLQQLRTQLDEKNAQANTYDAGSSSSAANHATVLDR